MAKFVVTVTVGRSFTIEAETESDAEDEVMSDLLPDSWSLDGITTEKARDDARLTPRS